MAQNPAGFWIRFGALIIDSIIFIPVLFFFKLLGLSTNAASNLSDLIQFLYNLILPVKWYGYTVGKKAVSIQIIRIDGEPIGFGTTAKRYLLGSLVYVITLGIGCLVSVFMVAFRQDKRSIHDLIAGTQVVYVTKN